MTTKSVDSFIKYIHKEHQLTYPKPSMHDSIGLANFKMMTFTIKPFCKHYLSQREMLLSKLKAVPVSLISKMEKMDEDFTNCLLELLQYYGCYKMIFALRNVICFNPTYYEESYIALENYNQMPNKTDSSDIALFYAIVQVKNKIPINQRLFLLLQSAFFQLIILVEMYVNEAPFKYYQYHLGYIMVFCSNFIYDLLNEETHLRKRLKFYRSCLNKEYDMRIEMKFQHKSMSVIINDMKHWNINDIEKLGTKHLLKACFTFRHICGYDTSARGYYIWAQYESQIKERYDIAKMYYLVAITAYPAYESLMCRALALIGLTENCYKNEEYFVGKKVLNIAYKVCKGYLFTSFIETKYPKYKRKLLEKVCGMNCVNCGTDNRGLLLKVCTACMKVSYCSKRCQKIHWKLKHKRNCNKTWKYLYHCLKNYVFDAFY
eukprot:339218_1